MNDEKNQLPSDAQQTDLDKMIADIDQTLEKMSRRLEELSNTTPVATTTVKGTVPFKSIVATLIATFSLICSLALCTYAFFTSDTESSGNIISTGYAGVILHDTTDASYLNNTTGSYSIFPGYTVKKNVNVENIGIYPLYVRIQIVSEISLDDRYNEHESEIDTSLVTYSIDRETWTERDGYYYYNVALDCGEHTADLFTAVSFSDLMGNMYKDSTIKTKILLEVVQANGNGDTVFDAVGWTSAEEGGVA